MQTETFTHEGVAIRAIVQLAGGITPLAAICECSVSNISQLVRRGSPLPARHVLRVEKALGLSRSLIRPDLYPREAA